MMNHKKSLIAAALSLTLVFPFISCSYEKNDLVSLNLEDLMNVEIETASKKNQRISDTPAAAFVMTSEDIKRSGATNIMDLLRLVPGVHVARIDANKWAITCRGFNSRFSNKLLVMIDGRTIYSPLFSGVFWDMQDIIIEDIEKIEVVRGPGSTLWGANAVNGVINIITKSASKSLGTRIDSGSGNEEKIYTSARFGGKIKEGITYRVSGKYSDRDRGWSPSGSHVDDSWNTSRADARIDIDKDHTKAFFMAGFSDTDISESDLYNTANSNKVFFMAEAPDRDTSESGIYNTVISDPAAGSRFLSINQSQKISDSFLYGQYTLAKIEKNLDNTSKISFQAYFDRTIRNNTSIEIEQNITDLDFQYRLPTIMKNDIITGFGARFMNDSLISNNSYYWFNPAKDSYNLQNLYFQDEIELVENVLFFTAGTKLEKNDFSGSEFQPSARALIKLDDATSLWCSVSRAVRTPSRGEEAGVVALKVPVPGLPDIFLRNNPSVLSEKLIAYEIGIKSNIRESQSIDITFFLNDYTDLETVEMTDDFEFMIENKMKGYSKGAEIFYEIDIMHGWMMSAGYSYFIMDLKKMGEDPFNYEFAAENADQRHKVELRSAFDISDKVRLDLWIRYVDKIKTFDIPSYCSADAVLGWQITPNIEFSLSARDIFDESHPEYPPEILQTLPTELERSLFAKITWEN